MNMYKGKGHYKVWNLLIFFAFFPLVITVETVSAVGDTVDTQEKTLLPAQPLPDIYIGSQEALMEIIVYSAFTCNHCAEFHLDVLKRIQKTYVDPKKVRIVIRDFPLDYVSLKASMIAHTMTHENYLLFSDHLYKTQRHWIDKKDPMRQIKKMALNFGLEPQDVKNALNNQRLEHEILTRSIEGLKKYKLDSTPSIIVGNHVFKYAPTFQELSEKIDHCLAKKSAK